MARPTVPATDRVGAGRRVFVLGLLAVVVLAGFGGVEWWPLTGWRLYSHLRTERSVTWEAATVDDRGVEQVLDPQDLPLGFRHLELILSDFPSTAADGREAVCEALADEARADEHVVEEIRVYRVVEVRALDDGDVELERDPELRYVCARGNGR